MARILREDEYNAKRNEILDMARHLIYTKGYGTTPAPIVLSAPFTGKHRAGL